MGLVGLVFELVVLGSCAAGVVFNGLMVGSCEMLKLQVVGQTVGTLGLFKWSSPLDEGEDCSKISDDTGHDIEDGAFNTARTCALLAYAFGGVLFVCAFFKQCLFPLPCSNLLMDVSSTIVQICLSLVWVIYLSEACDWFSCSRGIGLDYLIVCQLCWLCAGCFTRCMREGRSERKRDNNVANK